MSKSLFCFLITLYTVLSQRNAWSKEINISWELKKGVDSYNVYVYRNNDRKNIFKFLNSKTNFADIEISDAGRYEYQIVPVIDSQEYTNFASTGFVQAKFEAMEVKVVDQEIKWKGVGHAASYTVEIKNGDRVDKFETTQPSFSKFKASAGDTISITANDENNNPISEVSTLAMTTSSSLFNFNANGSKRFAFFFSYNQNSISSSVLNNNLKSNPIGSFNAYEWGVFKMFGYNSYSGSLGGGQMLIKNAGSFVSLEGQLAKRIYLLGEQDLGLFIQRKPVFLNNSTSLSLDGYLRYGILWKKTFFEKLELNLKQGFSSGQFEFIEPAINFKLSSITSFFLDYFQSSFDVYDSSTKKIAIKYKIQEIKLGLKLSF